MKNRLLPLFLCFLALCFQSCQDDCSENLTYITYRAITKSMTDIRSEAGFQVSQELKNPGKIYYYNNYLLISEEKEGIHFIDNSDVANPKNIGFLALEGNTEMAVNKGYLYANAYRDLAVIDLSNMQSPQIMSWSLNAFPDNYPTSDDEIITDWVEVEVVEDNQDCGYYTPGWRLFESNISFMASGSSVASIAPPTTGLGGSMAGFTISQDRLYTLTSKNKLKSFDISDALNPSLENSIYVAWGLETIFLRGDNLFLGAETGMHIVDISTPGNPQHISSFNHIRSCDPVVVQGDYAYVTLRSGSRCNDGVNKLEVVDISDLNTPLLVKSYDMINPHGLGIDGDKLFICEGASGLKRLNADNVQNIEQVAHYQGFDAFDLILHNDVLMLIGDNGLYQYDYTSANDLTLLSTIPVGQ